MTKKNKIAKKIEGATKLFGPIIKNTKNWPILILNRAKILKNNILVYKFRNGLKFSIENAKNKFESSGMATITEIIIYKNYNPPGFEIKENDIIIDIGANIGIFSIYSSLNAKKGKIYAFEPFKKHFSKLNKNLRLNNLANVKTFNLAVGKKKGKRDFFVSETHTGAHSLLENKDTRIKTTVEVIGLKQIFEENKIKECDLLKIDCEGGEYEILYSTPKKILDKIKKIALEFDNLDNSLKNGISLKKYLEKKGFEVKIEGGHDPSGILYAKRK